MKQQPPHYFLSLLCLCLTVFLPIQLAAQKVIPYTGEAGTDIFSDAGNWADQIVPGPADTALFSLPGDYEITFKENTSIAMLRMQDGGEQSEPDKLILRLGGKKLALLAPASEHSGEMAITLSASVQAPRILIFEGGSLEFCEFWQATHRGNFPTALIFDKGMSVECTGMGWTAVYGEAKTYLIGGSKWVSNGKGWAGVVGHTEGSNGLFEISGPGSSFSAKTETDTPPLDVRIFYVSTKGNGILRILDGASFACDVVNLGNGLKSIDTFSLVVVDGPDSVFSVDRLNVGGGSNNLPNPAEPTGNALFMVSNKAAAKVGALKVFSHDGADGIPAFHGRVLIDGGTFEVGGETPKPSAEFAPDSCLEFRLRGVPSEAPFRSETELKIEGANLVVTLDPAFRAAVGDPVPLVSCQIVEGTFKDLPEGAAIKIDAYSFSLSYALEGANVIGLKVTGVNP